ncbi:MAG: endonuclease V, partial [Alphaproteobacteria bacterium]
SLGHKDWVPLLDKDEVIGAVVRTRAGVKPLYVSIGHRISLATAVTYVLAASGVSCQCWREQRWLSAWLGCS